MPANYARFLIGHQRSVQGNRQLGLALAFVAGAINAGGFLAVRQYTSHVTGMLSSLADHVALQQFAPVLGALVGVLAFLTGAGCSAAIVLTARRHQLASAYALPLLLEALLVLCFGLLGPWLQHFEAALVPLAVLLLCFIMGLQNAVTTKLSNAVIRTTHMTGVVTDLGIELGRLAVSRQARAGDPTPAVDLARIAVLAGLLLAFVGGGIAGAFGFKSVGYVFTVPIAIVLALLALVPMVDDLRRVPVEG